MVDKDRSLEGFVESGYDEFAPLVEFRNWLVSIRSDSKRRQATRRNGKATLSKNGKLIPGPYTLETRSEILDRLLDLQDKVGNCLINEAEVSHIHKIWSDEVKAYKYGELELKKSGEGS